MFTRKPTPLLLLLAPVPLLLGGCPNGIGSIISDLVGDLTGVTVEIVNDSGWTIEPDIRYSEDDGDFAAFIAGLFGGDELSVPLMAPGADATYNFNCDSLGVIYSGQTVQYGLLGFELGEADASDILVRGDDYSCGDTITFTYVGSGDSFGVVVSINGQVVD